MPPNKVKQDGLSHETLLSLLHYSPDTGAFTWVKDRTGGTKAGNQAGRVSMDGRRQIKVLGKLFYSNRLALFYVTGRWPEGHVDHINRDPLDDRLSNLRQLSPSSNNRNSEYCLKDCFGVTIRKDRKNTWRVYILEETGRNPKFFGQAKTLEQAIDLSWFVRAKLGLWDHVEGMVEEFVRRGLR